MPDSDPIKISKTGLKERKRRKREMWLALFFFCLIGVLTWVQLKYLGVNYLFMGIFNINLILLLVVLFIVCRNGVKLLLERRRKALGSRLRTRLVGTFILLSLIPTVLMFLVAIKFVQTSTDYWFKNQVEDSMEQALEVGRSFYGAVQEGLERRALHVEKSIHALEFPWGGKRMDRFLEIKLKEYDLSLIGLIDAEGQERDWHSTPAWETAWPEIKGKIDWKQLKANPRWWSTIQPTPGNDLIVGLLPVDEGKTGWLVMGESIGQGLLYKLDQVVRGFDEYRELKSLKSPWKMTLYLTMGLMAMLIIMGAIWFGFRLSKEISAPVQALAAGTERISRGELSVRLEDQSSDELGFLVQSFNRMAEDLEQSRMSLQAANERLAQQNMELDQRGRYMAAVLNNITAGVVSLDAGGRISTVNHAAESLLGIDAANIEGRSPLQLLHGEHAEIMSEVLGQMELSPASQWQRQMSLVVDGREVKLLVNVVTLRNESGRHSGLVAVFEDITELEKMQRLAAWREVAKRIAHEIKNPLTPIKLSAQRLQRKYGAEVDDPVFGECTELIVRQVEHMQRMVSEFSTFAKLPEVTPRLDDFTSLLEEVVGMFENTHREIAWNVRFDNTIPQFMFDREAMRRVMINLLTNAAEVLAGRQDGSVEVAAEYDPVRGMARTEVRDNGPGMSQDERARMFEPYFSRKRGGTGLGLSIVKSVVTDHRGFVRVRPNNPAGTVFEVELPVT